MHSTRHSREEDIDMSATGSDLSLFAHIANPQVVDLEEVRTKRRLMGTTGNKGGRFQQAVDRESRKEGEDPYPKHMKEKQLKQKPRDYPVPGDSVSKFSQSQRPFQERERLETVGEGDRSCVSQNSHRSHGSHRSHRSHRSHDSHRSHRSHRSHGSHRSPRSPRSPRSVGSHGSHQSAGSAGSAGSAASIATINRGNTSTIFNKTDFEKEKEFVSENVKNEEYREKQGYLLQLQKFVMQGIKPSREYTQQDTLADIQFECDQIRTNQRTTSSVKKMKFGLTMIIRGITAFNNRWPILALDDGESSWQKEQLEQIREKEYDDVLERLYLKHWRQGGSSSPEWDIGVMLFGSLGMYHLEAKSNKAKQEGKSPGLYGTLSTLSSVMGMKKPAQTVRSTPLTVSSAPTQPTQPTEVRRGLGSGGFSISSSGQGRVGGFSIPTASTQASVQPTSSVQPTFSVQPTSLVQPTSPLKTSPFPVEQFGGPRAQGSSIIWQEEKEPEKEPEKKKEKSGSSSQEKEDAKTRLISEQAKCLREMNLKIRGIEAERLQQMKDIHDLHNLRTHMISTQEMMQKHLYQQQGEKRQRDMEHTMLQQQLRELQQRVQHHALDKSQQESRLPPPSLPRVVEEEEKEEKIRERKETVEAWDTYSEGSHSDGDKPSQAAGCETSEEIRSSPKPSAIESPVKEIVPDSFSFAL